MNRAASKANPYLSYHVSLIVLVFAMLLSSQHPALAQFSQQGPKLVGTGAIDAQQGFSVSLSADGNTAIVGGYQDNGYAGAAWVWTRSGGVWTQQGTKLVGSGAVGYPVPHAEQGWSVSLSADGNTAIVGGRDDDGIAGAAWIWTRSGGVWTQQGNKLVGSGAVGYAQQGYSVSLSADGNTAIVGGYWDNNYAGAAWVWTRSGGVWTQQGNKLVGSGVVGGYAEQGCTVSLSADGNTAIVGGQNDNNYAGAAWVWTRSGGVWTQQGNKLVGSGAVTGYALQGFSVSLSADGNTAIVGGAGDNNYAGAAWVWTRSGGVWAQQGTKLVGSGAVGNAHGGSEQGCSVSLSADGNRALVGGLVDNGAAGAAWVWTRSGGVWAQQGTKLVGSGAVGSAWQGNSVAISADGTTAIVGGPEDDILAGAAWVFTASAPSQEPNWTQKNPANAPSARWLPAMAYDAARGQVVMFGGYRAGFGYGNDTWVWDGTNWTQKSPATSPAPRYGHGMAYDAARGQVVMFGGVDMNNVGQNDTWVWDGTNWTQKSPAASPAPRVYPAMAYDAARGQVVMFGGFDDINNVGQNDTWVWDGTNWTQKSPATSPAPRYFHAMAYDVAHGQVVLFGGWNNSLLNDTWVWDGTNWTQNSPSTSPPPRIAHAMAYDAAHGQVVMFGGSDNTVFLNDTWVWDGTNWAQNSPSTSPPARNSHAMAYDVARGQVVMFGGGGNNNVIYNDTWVFTTSASGPSAAWTVPPPSSISAGQTFQVAWAVSGSPTHVNVHWDPVDPKALTASQTVAGSTRDSTVSPTASPATLTAPIKNPDGTPIALPTTVYYVVHVVIAGSSEYSTVVPVTVYPACGAPSPTPILLGVGDSPTIGCLSKGQVQVYAFAAQASQLYSILLTPASGDPDLYASASQACINQVPAPSSCGFSKSTNPGLLVDSLGVMAAGTGTYYIAVYGYKDTIYTIQVVGNKPLAKFDASSNAPHSGEPVAFTATASLGSSTSCAIAAYAWDFGDGSTATGVGPTRVFTPTGTATYTVQLTVTDCNGQTDSKTMPITVTGLALSRNNQQSFSKDPVNLATGNYAYEHVDLRIPGRGTPFEFTRAYNSRANQFNGAGLAPGWTHSYHVTVSGDPALSVAVLWGTGNSEIYTHNADGSYTAEAGVFNVLVNNGDGTFTLTTKDQVRYSFDALGRLATITDKNGNALSLTYDASGNLDFITDTAGRTIDFVFDANNRITQIIDPLGRKVEFSYDANGDLVSAKDLKGGITGYAYDAFHQMTSATDPKGQQFVSNVYDAQSRVVQAQADALGNQTAFSYDFETRVTTVTDALGNQSVYCHDAQLRVVAIKDGLGNVQTFDYDADNNRTKVVDKRGFATSYSYDARGNVIQKVDALSNQTSIEYDARNNPTKRTDAIGNITSYAYDAKGNLTQTTDPLGNVSSISYDAFGQAVSVTDANGKVTANTFDAQGNLLQTQDPLGDTTSFTYDAVGRRLTRVDANGNTTTYAYDANSNLLTVTDPLAHTVTYAYDANNNRVSTTDARGGVTTSAYDAKDRLISVQNALGGITAYEYDALDRKTKTTDPRSGVTEFAYDAVGNLIQVTDALGHVTHYAYDANGNQTASTDPLNHTTTTLYDALNRRIQAADALGNTTQYAYDAVGRRTQTTDADGKVTQFGYDALGRLTQVTDANSGIVTYAYDAVGNRTAVIDPNGHSTTYQYDAANRLAQKTEPSRGVYQYGYDGTGNRTSQLDPNGNTISYSYDANDRLTGVSYPSGSPVAFTYDANGNRTGMTDGLGSTSFVYDALNRMVSSTDAYGMTVSYAYDANGNRTSLTYPGSKAVTYVYDVLNRLVSATDWLNGVTAYTYDAAGNFVHTTNPNATTASCTYDSANRLTGLINAQADASAISSYTLTLDGVGNHLQSAQQEPLTPAIPNQNTTYAYDNDNRLTSAGATAFTYDANGNMTAKGADTLEYDFENRLTQASVAGVSYQYQYDGLGNRFAKTVNGVGQRFVLDVNGRLSHVLAETDGSGTITAYYVYGLGLISRITPSGTVAYYHYDVRGSTVALSDSTGALTDKYAYDPFGQMGNRRGTSANAFRYLGRFGVMDEGNGLAFIRARYFSPEHGRFITKDPITGKDGDSQSLHRYLYALNNPVRMIDISGFSPLDSANQPNLNGTSDQQHYPLVELHRLTKEQAARIVQAQQEALKYQLQAINYEAEANVLQGVYDALQTTESLLTGDVPGVIGGLSHQLSTYYGITGNNTAANALNFVGTAGDITSKISGFIDATGAASSIGSGLTANGNNLIKDVGFNALLLDASNPVAKAYSDLVTPTLDLIFYPH